MNYWRVQPGENNTELESEWPIQKENKNHSNSLGKSRRFIKDI